MKQTEIMPYHSTSRFTPQHVRRRWHSIPLLAAVIILAAAVLLFFRGRAAFASVSPPVEPEPVQIESTSDTNTLEESKTPDEPSTTAPLFTVCLDAGHGGVDAGCATEERYERDDNLRLTLAIQEAMEAQGIQVILTRSDDTYLSLEDRCAIANEAEADFFLSLHRNYASGIAYGVEVWKSHNASDEASALADAVSAALEEVGVQRNRGIHTGSQSSDQEDYYVLRSTSMPSLLIEMGFLENAEDNRLFDTYLNDYAEAITQAVLDTYEEFHGEFSA